MSSFEQEARELDRLLTRQERRERRRMLLGRVRWMAELAIVLGGLLYFWLACDQCWLEWLRAGGLR